MPSIHHLLRWLTLWFAAGVLASAFAAPAQATLQLDDDRPDASAWPHLRMMVDNQGTLTEDAVQRRLAEFQVPDVPESNLGPRREVVWLHLPLRVVGGDGQWVLHIDYPPLNRVDLTVLQDGRPVQRHRLGSAQPFDARPLPSRAHAVQLQLTPGARYDLLMRVSTSSVMLVPVTLTKPAQFHFQESRAAVLQGVFLGVGLALLFYSLAHWASLHDPVFLEYALLIAGVCTFFLAYFGIGQQHLWSDQTGEMAKIAPLGVLVALAAAGQFVASALQTRQRAPRAHWALMALSVVSTAAFVASLAGVLDYRLTQSAAATVGPVFLFVVIPLALEQARQGDRIALYMLLGWSAYMVGALTLASLLRGWLPVGFWTQHLFQFASLVEMMAWTRVLGLRIEGIRRDAERTELEKQALVSLAHTDALTGLPNRRGLQQAMAAALPGSRGDRVTAVFLLDLDGFKPVNDRWGHDAGDDLLVQVGKRLRDQVRHGDVVARLGGDEFVIMATGLAGEADAFALGRKLLDAFHQPFKVPGDTCRVGLTIGFALAPHDGLEAEDLLKRADAAMYAGKQAGRHTVRRGGASVGLAG